MKHTVTIIESESGWGTRVEEVRVFDDWDSAAKFVIEFNAENDKTEVPDWYMYAQAPEEQKVEYDDKLVLPWCRHLLFRANGTAFFAIHLRTQFGYGNYDFMRKGDDDSRCYVRIYLEGIPVPGERNGMTLDAGPMLHGQTDVSVVSVESVTPAEFGTMKGFELGRVVLISKDRGTFEGIHLLETS